MNIKILVRVCLITILVMTPLNYLIGQELYNPTDKAEESAKIKKELNEELVSLEQLESQEAASKMKKKIPVLFLGGHVKIPTTWVVYSKDDLIASLNKIDFPTPEAKNYTLRRAKTLGRKIFCIKRYQEPYAGCNPSFLLMWEIPTKKIKDRSSENLGRLATDKLIKEVLPTLQEHSRDYELIENPRRVQETPMAYATIKSMEKYIDGTWADIFTRIYVMIQGDYVITIYLQIEDIEEAKNKEELWEIFQSLKFEEGGRRGKK